MVLLYLGVGTAASLAIALAYRAYVTPGGLERLLQGVEGGEAQTLGEWHEPRVEASAGGGVPVRSGKPPQDTRELLRKSFQHIPRGPS